MNDEELYSAESILAHALVRAKELKRKRKKSTKRRERRLKGRKKTNMRCTTKPGMHVDYMYYMFNFVKTPIPKQMRGVVSQGLVYDYITKPSKYIRSRFP